MFKSRLDKYRHNQKIIFDNTAEITRTRNRSEYVLTS